MDYLYNEGRERKYLDIAIKRGDPPLPKAAILLDIKEVVDLDIRKKDFIDLPG